MPTYEYRCPNGHEFERFQKITDESRAACPTCGETGERLLSGGMGFLFKGDGFYSTDYRSESYRREASKDVETKQDTMKEKDSATGTKPPAGKGEDSGSPSKGE